MERQKVLLQGNIMQEPRISVVSPVQYIILEDNCRDN